ncbi:MAG: double-strand break repair protein AddB [Pseudomonadota bacterium]
MTKPEAFFDTLAPRVFTIPAPTGFAGALASTLQRAFPDPNTRADITILTPTRRAGRAMASAFAAADSQAAALLPIIRPIGDVDADDPPFEPGELAELAPPAISSARRRFELANLILQKEKALDRSLGVGGALALADHLAALIDDLATEDETADLDRINAELRAALPAHMQEAALFLDIVMEAWPSRLDELGAVDPARRRSLILRALAERWREAPPQTAVIAAGSTGSIPAAAELLRVVAQLPLGAVVLPGFQRDIDAAAWASIDEAHPQRAMKAFAASLNMAPGDVTLWPGSQLGRGGAARERVINEALRPAEATSDWLNRVETLNAAWGGPVFEAALDGLSVIEAREPADEARAIAAALRETLETPGRTALVATPDRALAHRVCVEMRRYGVELDDSAGIALSDSAVGGLLMRILQAALDPGSAQTLSALAASPLFALGEARGPMRARFGAMERAFLRGRRPGRDFASIRKLIEASEYKDKTDWLALTDQIEAALEPLLRLGDGQHAIADWAGALTQSGEALAGDGTHPGSERLWAGEAGEAAANLLREFIHEAEALPPLSGAAFARAYLETARTRRVRPRYGAHPRLQVLGPLEARLIEADRVILAGLNEGVWPAAAKIDPFISPGMRQAAGLSAPERRFGLAAHDFAQLACARDVLLTRSQRVDGAPTVASRWLWRLQTLARGALGDGVDDALKAQPDYHGLGRRMDPATNRVRAASEPAPKPPVSARPRQLPVTSVETWIRDPYSIFARRILKLKPLRALDEPPGPAERGTAYHTALEDWVRALGDGADFNADALSVYGLSALREQGFTDAELGQERPRFERAARWFAAFEAERRVDPQAWRPVALEEEGEWTFAAPGGAFTLTARADRIDLGADGSLSLIDYKTGGFPSDKEVLAGFAPQLPLTAAIASRGGFEGVPTHEFAELRYVRVSGGREPGKTETRPNKAGLGQTRDLAEAALSALERWVAAFDDPDQPYLSQPRRKHQNAYGDYDHLARRREWSAAGLEPGEAGGDTP